MVHNWKPQRVAPKAVQRREELQMREGSLDASHVKSIAQAMEDGREVLPIKVARIGRALCVIDGFHRLAAADMVGLEGIEALVAPMDMRAARAEARVVNVGHGAKLRPRDKAKAFADYIEAGDHLNAHGSVKSSRTIKAELPGLYSHTQVLKRLKVHKIRPSYDDEVAEGSKWGTGYPEDAEGEDIDDYNDGDVGPLDPESADRARGHLEAVEALYFAVGERHREATLVAVRELLGRLEANVPPTVPEAVMLDI